MNDRFDFASAQDVERVEAKLDELIAMLKAPPPKQFYTVAEAAEMLGRTERTVRRKIDSGALETVHVGGVRMVKIG